MTDQTITARGVNGTVTLSGELLTIEKRGLGNRGTKSIPLRAIGGVQIKPASALVNGFIQFSVSGETTRSSGGPGRSMNAATDENAVIFTKKQTPDFEAVRDAVLAAL